MPEPTEEGSETSFMLFTAVINVVFLMEPPINQTHPRVISVSVWNELSLCLWWQDLRFEAVNTQWRS